MDREPQNRGSYEFGFTSWEQWVMQDDKEIKWVSLDGNNLEVEDLVKIGLGVCKVVLTRATEDVVNKSRAVIDKIIEAGELEDKPVYGINTGFGENKNKVISKEQLGELQVNLIRSHASGVGPPLNQMRTRMLLALRINVLAKGYSGIRLKTLKQLVEALNASCLSYVPEKGSVGASGDLAPLSHLILGLMGEGQMWSPETGWAPAADVLKSHGLKPITLEAKEGLALNNGTQLITALGAEALFRAERIAKQADIVAALTVEVLEGVPDAFDKEIHLARPHAGQKLCAERIRSLVLDGGCSKIARKRLEWERDHKDVPKKVQDAYTLRCIPQVHGVVHDTLNFVRGILKVEMNSATDNPVVLTAQDKIMSGGNFHGEYPGKALDYLAIGIHELANISERRIDRLTNPALNEVKLFKDHTFLCRKEAGLNNAFMIPQYTAAALVSENKVLTHPSTVDSITTCCGSEDHVSMGAFAARKALAVVEHVEYVLGIELLAACQALDFHHDNQNTTTPPLERVFDSVRSVVSKLEKDRYMSPDINSTTKLLWDGKVWEAAFES